MLLTDAARNYITYLCSVRRLAVSTVTYRKRTFANLASFLGDVPVADIKRAHLESFYGALALRCGAGHQLNQMVSIAGLFGWLEDSDVITRSPARHIQYPRPPERLPRVLSNEDALSLVNAPDPETPIGMRDRVLLALLYGAGLRNSEARHMRVADVHVREHYVFVDRGKREKDRYAYFPEHAAVEIQRYLRIGRPALLGSCQRDTGYLYLNQWGRGPLDVHSISSISISWSIKVLGVKVHPHMLRHTCATHLLQGGANLASIQKLLGHKSLATTGIYTHVANQTVRRDVLACHPLSHSQVPADVGTYVEKGGRF